jgi:cytidylate kinase
MDSTRNDSPLIKADDAIELDNSELSLEQQFDIVLSLAKDKIEMVNKKP